jgi:hypothetical protein
MTADPTSLGMSIAWEVERDPKSPTSTCVVRQGYSSAGLVRRAREDLLPGVTNDYCSCEKGAS